MAQETLDLILVPILAGVCGLPLVALTSYYFEGYLPNHRLLAELRREIEEIGVAKTATNNGLSAYKLKKLLKDSGKPFLQGLITYLKEKPQHSSDNQYESR